MDLPTQDVLQNHADKIRTLLAENEVLKEQIKEMQKRIDRLMELTGAVSVGSSFRDIRGAPNTGC